MATIFTLNGQRFNIARRYDHPVHGKQMDMTIAANREKVGVIETTIIDPPEDYSDETYFRTEQNEAPFVVYTKKPQRMLDQIANSKVKAQIAALEAGQGRAVREAALGDTTRLAALDAEIAALRATLIEIPPEEPAP